MFLRELDQPITSINGLKDKKAEPFIKAGLCTVADLLGHYPRDWEDRSRSVPLKDFSRFPAICTVITVLAHDWIGFGRMRTLKVHVEDDTGRAVLVCFNRPWLEKQLVVGNRYQLWGRHFHYKYGELQCSEFETEPLGVGSGPTEDGAAASGTGSSGRSGSIIPVYPLSAGLTVNQVRRFVKQALIQYGASIEEELPQAIIERDGLLPKSQAVRAIHFPASMAELNLAQKTLVYGELFYLEVIIGRRALERRRPGATKTTSAAQVPLQGKAPDLDKNLINNALAVNDASFTPLQQRLIERLPFSLTAGQTGAIAEINSDMDSPWPMARLLQGDVGSGKTLVSFLAALKAVESGGQAAIMAPTELLARQHAENAARLLEPIGIRLSFLTGNIKAAGRKELLKRLAAGEIDIALGTHALFSQDVVYHDLRLAVVDEQHRFGVTQRSLIMAKGDHPGLLMMSATPIPRTLALTVFGDLDVSLIRDLPPGRKPIKTHLAKEANEDKVYGFVRKELAAGRQAYFVYPLIEASEAGGRTADLKDAESMADRLAREVFPQYKTALVHSRLDEEEKRQTMDAFRRGEIRLLVATSVVEVGVDVPNATCMVIEHAERFGLSALHQLRGRVGRGEQQSYCFLVYSDPEGPLPTGENIEDWQARLKVMLESNDGFVIAEEDLKIRGPGQIAGIEQSGYLSLGLANPIRDAAELERARADAFAILEADPGLLRPENRCIAEVLERAAPFGGVGV
ncbi:ATP-dependent DNA helicase RecG [Spirochaetia bacterium]|nr:ATP-dependent DNA helicase RecG [Spirochaetia bacterium]